MRKPSISVLMPVYNAAPYLKEAIDSILSQTFSDFEFLIINDGSTDNSEEIILSYNDTRIRYVKNEQNIKLIATLNRGIALCKGEYIARMDADDVSLPTRLETQFTFMESHPDVALCGSWFVSLDNDHNISKYKPTHNEIMFQMLFQCHLCHPSLMLRRKNILYFDLKFDINFSHAEDYDFFVRIGRHFQLANIQEVLLKYRIHEGSVSAKHKSIQIENSIKIKQREFHNIGIEINNILLEDFTRLNYQDYDKILSSTTTIKTLLEDLILANEKAKYFDQAYFSKKLSSLWFNFCYHKTTINTYSTSPLLSKKIETKIKIKWILKRLMAT